MLPDNEKKALAKDKYLKAKYAISLDDYKAMYEAQGGVCAICGKPPKKVPLNVDHCHINGYVRGLLCWFCNLHVVEGRKTVDLLTKAIEYLLEPPAHAVIGVIQVPKKKRKKRVKEASSHPNETVVE